MKPELEVKRLVAAHPFLKGAKPPVLRVFEECASLQDYGQGQQLFHEGGKADHFYLITSGEVLLQVFVPGHGTVTIQALGAGEALGWSWLFPPHLWHFSATAVKPIRVIRFPARILRTKAKQNHEFCYELVVRLAGVLAGRLDDVRTRLIYAYE